MNPSGFSLFPKSGIYYISYIDESGRRRQKSTKCVKKSEAMKVFAHFEKLIIDGQKPKKVPLSHFKRDFLAYAEKNMCPSTRRSYALSLQDFIRITGDIDMNKITPKHWDNFKTARLSEHVLLRRKRLSSDEAAKAQLKQRMVSPVTVNVELRHIKAAMSTATRWQLIRKNPFEKLSLVAIPKRTPAYLTMEMADGLLKVISEQWVKDIVIFAINTGMRRGEFLALRWCDIDMPSRIARITNRKDFQTKTGEERIVSLNDAAVSVLLRRKAQRHSEYVFTDERGRRLEPCRVTHVFKKAIRGAGLSEELHVHSLRHSFASLLVGNGTSLFIVSKLLGHANAMTSEIYSHLLPQHLQTEVNKLNIGTGLVTI